ncbi:MAG: PilZ domain-containing protein [Terriglobales bacterium]
MTDTAPNRLERRSAQRFEVLLPMAVHFDGRMLPAFTQNLSGRGIFFYAEAAIPEGAIVELVFAMPSEVTLSENMPVRCRGRVLRSAPPKSSQRNGIAVQLESYEYLPANEFLPISHVVRVSVPSPSEISRPVSR